MTPFVLPERPRADVVGGGQFPIGRIFCIGRNYAEHAREMGKDPTREAPFFFTKWADAAAPGGGDIPYPPQTSNYQFEGELVVAIGAGGKDVAEERAHELIFGYAAGLDMTRRDLQLQAREMGRPWDAGKNFSHSAPLGPISKIEDIGQLTTGALTLRVNGEVKQQCDVSEMIWSVSEIISYLTRFERLQPGDLIFTGTPAGVAAVNPGDEVTLQIANLQELSICVVK